MTPFEAIFGARLKKYQYTPIPQGSRTFRLVRLLSAEPVLLPGREPTLRIALLTCEVGGSSATPSGDVVDYDALSYSWDVLDNTKRPNRRIIIETAGSNERRYMYIYRSLEVALLAFLAANAENGEKGSFDLPLFVDQICIDQENDEEKSQQVPLMQDIYAHCRRTIIWLGPSTKGTDMWFRYARRLAAEGILSGILGPRASSAMTVYDACMDPSITLTDEDEIQDREDLLDLIARYSRSYPIAMYVEVLRRNWFSRLWTIQEACLAPAVVFVCGAEVLCLECFRVAVFFYNVQNSHWISTLNGAVHSREELLLRNSVFSLTEGFIRVNQERKAIHQRRQRNSFQELLIKYSIINESGWKIGATLAQDRVYGLLGLIDADKEPVSTRLGIYYDKDNQVAAQVKAFTEVAALLLEQGHMDILLFNQTPKVTVGLPTWVPDWAMNLVLPVGWATLQNPNFAAGGAEHAGAVKSEPAGAIATLGGGRLTLRGVLVSRIVAVGKATYTTQPRPLVMAQIEYGDARVMFDEVDEFVRAAASSTSPTAITTHLDAASGASPETEDPLASTRLRVYDGGLSVEHFVSKYPSRTVGLAHLANIQGNISKIGGMSLKSQAAIRSYSLHNIYSTIGITPWYIDYYRSTTILHQLARGPIHLARTLLFALVDLIDDCVAMTISSARVSLAGWWVYWRQRNRKIQLEVAPDVLRGIGLDPDVVLSKDSPVFSDNLIRNVGRKVFRTDHRQGKDDGGGFVGMGPGHMKEGDAVVVIKGVTTPLVLRRVEEDAVLGSEKAAAATTTTATEKSAASATETWTLVGEAYCDGVMHGEALLSRNEREFVLV